MLACWPEPVDMGGSRLWNEAEDRVFDSGDLGSLVAAARAAGFEVPELLTDGGEPVVEYRGRRYTFVLMTFRKPAVVVA